MRRVITAREQVAAYVDEAPWLNAAWDDDLDDDEDDKRARIQKVVDEISATPASELRARGQQHMRDHPDWHQKPGLRDWARSLGYGQ